jgi:hypothetical protein
MAERIFSGSETMFFGIQKIFPVIETIVSVVETTVFATEKIFSTCIASIFAALRRTRICADRVSVHQRSQSFLYDFVK